MRRVATLLSVVGFLAACASGGRFGRVADQLIVFPTPPDTARIQFLFTFSDKSDVRGERTGLVASVLGDSPDAGGIIKPYGVDAWNGRFYVCDSMLPGVDIVDMDRQTFTPWAPRSLGALKKPINCTVDEGGRLYVTDTGRRQVVIFDSTGAYVDSFGESGLPTDVFVEEGRIWLTDLEQQSVRAFDRETLREIRSIPSAVSDTKLLQPTNLWVEGGLVYVSDLGDFNVKVFRTDGTFVRAFGSFGRGLGQFVRPKGIAVDRNGITYVVDAGFQNVQVFDPEGRLLLFFGGPYAGPGAMVLPAKVRVTYRDLDRYRPYVDPRFELEYVILVTNQYGPDRVNVYGFVRPAADGGGS